MSLLNHVQDIAFASSIPTDLILGTYTGSINAPATATTTFPAKTTTTAVVQTGIPEKTFFQGVFSVDNGVTWIDFNSNIVLTLGSVSNLQTQMAYAYSKPGTITIAADNWNRTSNNISWSAAAYTFLYKVVLFARPGQGNVTPQPIIQQRSFSSKYNYQKIFRDSVFPFSFPPSPGTAVLNHNLGYIPKFRSYIDNVVNATFSVPDTAALYDFGYFSSYTSLGLYMDNNTITYTVNNSGAIGNMTGTLYTRIYY